MPAGIAIESRERERSLGMRMSMPPGFRARTCPRAIQVGWRPPAGCERGYRVRAHARAVLPRINGPRLLRGDGALMNAQPSVRYEVTERIARLTLDRPERGNGITRGLIEELAACVERADLDPAVHVLRLSGEGPGFCGGYDLVESAEGMGAGAPAGERGREASPLDPRVIAANHDPTGTWDPMVDYAMMSRNVEGFMSLFNCRKPVVCM